MAEEWLAALNAFNMNPGSTAPMDGKSEPGVVWEKPEDNFADVVCDTSSVELTKKSSAFHSRDIHLQTTDDATISNGTRIINQSLEEVKGWKRTQNKRKQPDGTFEDIVSTKLAGLLKQHDQNAVSFLNQYCQQSRMPFPDYIPCVAFLGFLYLHLLKAHKSNDSLFDYVWTTGKFALKPRYSVHLYVSTTPCGDGRIFTMGEVPDVRNSVFLPHHEPFFNDIRKQGLLRCKIESGHGSITVFDCPKTQTLDGVVGGERIRTMSCSDKMLKWNVLGMQGCLLNQFVEPIYMSSITIGTLFHHGHMARALCCRLDDIKKLPTGFCVKHPHMGQGGTKKGRDMGKTKWTALNWNISEPHVLEIIDGGTGKTPCGLKSRLCKSQFYKLFKSLLASQDQKLDRDKSYAEYKEANKNYQDAKRVFVETLAKKNYGPWLNMPREEKMFQ